jgi:AcrR family transcriptional regulator
VNYYFGSKERLFEEMFLRRVIPLNEEGLAMLDLCLAATGPTPRARRDRPRLRPASLGACMPRG